MSGKLKKIIWLILMLELVIIHVAVLAGLLIRGYKSVLLIFLGGSLIMAIVQYCSYRFFIKNCAKNIHKLEDDKVNRIFKETVAELGGEYNTRIYENSETATPFVMGIFHQSIILPEECRKSPHLNLILLHEFYHVQRRDTLYKYVMLIANCFLWFHPLAYFIRYISYQDIEISCDEAVVSRKTKEERLEYGEFLIASARSIKEKSDAFNAYWNSSKSILKHRIDAVMNESRKWDTLAKIAIIILVLEAAILSVVLTKKLFMDYEKVTAPVNEYEGVVIPPIYNDEAIQQMIILEPVKQDTYCIDLFGAYDNQYPEKEYDEIEAHAQTPWQIRVKRPGPFGNAADVAIQRLYYYWEDQTAYNSIMYEQTSYYTTYELVYRTLLAGDINNSVWGYVWKIYCTDATLSESVNNGYAFTKEGEENYIYFTTAVQIKMVEPYLFEVVGCADLYQVMNAYEQKYETDIFSYIPQVKSFSAIAETDLDLKEQEALAIAFAEAKGMWDVRISFPENDQEGYLLGIIDKAAMQVYCVLYKTEDGGNSWKQIEMDAIGTEHRQIYDFAFVSNEEGYMAIYSFYTDSPQMLRTQDGGTTWENVQFSQTFTDFCQAFPPIYDGEKYIVYVGKEGSSIDRGEKACYESEDGGKTWSYIGQITFE